MLTNKKTVQCHVLLSKTPKNCIDSFDVGSVMWAHLQADMVITSLKASVQDNYKVKNTDGTKKNEKFKQFLRCRGKTFRFLTS